MGGNKRKPRTTRTVDNAGDCAPSTGASAAPSSPRSKRARLAKLPSDGRPGGAAPGDARKLVRETQGGDGRSRGWRRWRQCRFWGPL